jgi:hypothetical protein
MFSCTKIQIKKQQQKHEKKKRKRNKTIRYLCLMSLIEKKKEA